MRILVVALVLCMGCSFINDPNDHQVPGDAGAADARGEDGGFDGGPADSGSDAAPGDAVSSDARSDIGPSDTGPIDTGPSDIGPPDTPDVFDAGPPPSLTEAEYCAAFDAEMCRRQTNCCDTITDVANCEGFELFCVEQMGNLPPTLTYDGERAFTSIERLRALGRCDDGLIEYMGAGFFSPLVGSVAGGSQCSTPDLFVPTEIFRSALECEGELGDLVCLADSVLDSDWRCGPQQSTGDVCLFGFQCVSGKCMPDGVLAGRCFSGAGVDEACDANRPDQCASLVCKDEVCRARSPNTVYCDVI